MILGVINEIIEATEMLNEHITVANGCKRSIHVNTSDPLVNTTFHLRKTVRSIQQPSFSLTMVNTRAIVSSLIGRKYSL
jgi:hypothetical protein